MTEFSEFVDLAVRIAIVAHNKEWVRKVDIIFKQKPDCWKQTYCDKSCACEYWQWQQLKKSIEKENKSGK
jgi:hypothetical protein